jgi:hypothetical protein
MYLGIAGSILVSAIVWATRELKGGFELLFRREETDPSLVLAPPGNAWSSQNAIGLISPSLCGGKGLHFKWHNLLGSVGIERSEYGL